MSSSFPVPVTRGKDTPRARNASEGAVSPGGVIPDGVDCSVNSQGVLSVNVPGTSGTGAPPYLRFFGDGSDGPLNVATGQTATPLQGEYWHSSVTIAAGATLLPQPEVGQSNQSNGMALPYIIRSTGPVIMAGTIRFQVRSTYPNNYNGYSFGGGAGGGGGGGVAVGKAGSNMQFNAASLVTPNPSSLGGAAGAANGGIGGNAAGSIPLRLMHLLLTGQFYVGTSGAYILGGGSGGDGGSYAGTAGLSGGTGGAAVFIIAPSISFPAGALIDCSGGPGLASSGNGIGAGGGGGGGLVVLSAMSYVSQAGTINVAGAAGGGNGGFTNAGAGGAGVAGQKFFLLIQ
jgi:hypothetical protein